MHHSSAKHAAMAAQLVVEEGLEYGPAKRRAAKMLGTRGRTALPGNDELEAAVRDYIAVFCAHTQPAELLALRRLAQIWMQRLTEFRPHLSGAVWQGTATRRSDIYLQLFCDDSKAAEIALIDQGVKYQARSVNGFRGEPVPTLSLHVFCTDFQEEVGVHLMIHDHDDVRGALKPGANGRAARGDVHALQRLLAGELA
ncbi:MAG: hypothetical protein KBF66_00755 [Rhodoferax sp.]|uniref:hypothetical protein n=1 Tax=Rhodoferax sp. TaxID=50421 RepID=UPI001B5EE770|nr:hypothetical protein [Rhodoferax sp.]MBP9904057.1 hypothetical protein [Rhodoferax sp.]